MSMTYYAVTDDPNELAHFGIKGMKWGVRHDKPRHSGSKKPRSAAYKKAQNKLGRMMKSGIKKAEANWNAYNSPAAKYERQTNRAIQAARKGKLKYGKLTDDQVRRVTQRLELERQARQLSSTEQTFRHRLGKSITEGVITGIGQGVGRRTSEWIARGSTLKTDRLRAEQQDELDRAKEKRRMRNAEKEAKKKAKREFKQQQRKDEYEHERDKKYEEERIRNLYEYGASYDKDGKLDYTDRDKIENYYKNRYLIGESKTESRSRQERETAKHQRIDARNQRIAAQNQKKDYRAVVKRLDAEQKRYDEQQKRLQEEARQKELERYRKGIASLSAEASKRDADRAWESRQRRIAESSYTPRHARLTSSNKPYRRPKGRA